MRGADHGQADDSDGKCHVAECAKLLIVIGRSGDRKVAARRNITVHRVANVVDEQRQTCGRQVAHFLR